MLNSRPTASAVLAVAFVLFIGCGKKVNDAPAPSPNPAAQPNSDGPKPPTPTPSVPSLGPTDYKLTAHDFEREFNIDNAMAKAKYVGKVVELSGTVHRVAPHDAKQILISLSSVTGGLPFCSFLIGDHSLLEKVGRQQTIRLRGTCHFDTAPKQTYFTPSEVVEKGPDTIAHLTAEQIAKAYGSNPDAFEKKYADKTLLVSGEVIAVKTGAGNLTYMELKGDGKTAVQCYRLDWRDWKWPAKYKEGAKVRFIGSRTLARPEGAVRLDIETPLDAE